MCRRGQNDQNAESNLYTQESLSRAGVPADYSAQEPAARGPSRNLVIGQVGVMIAN